MTREEAAVDLERRAAALLEAALGHEATAQSTLRLVDVVQRCEQMLHAAHYLRSRGKK